MEHGRLELRHGRAEGMLVTAFKVCLSMKAVFLFILLLSLGYECALKRYAGLSVTTDNGKTTLQLSVHPKDGVDESDPSALAKLFKFSFSFSDETGGENDGKGNNGVGESQSQQVEEQEGVKVTEVDEHVNVKDEAEQVDGVEPGNVEEEGESVDDDAKELEEREEVEDEDDIDLKEKPGYADVKEEKLPSLKIKYVGNESRVGDATPTEDPFKPYMSTKTVRRDMNRAAESSATLLLVLLLLLVVLLLAFLVLCFNQSVITAVVGYSVACAYMRKPVRLTRALASGLKVGILRLMWLSVLYEMVRETHSLVLSWLLLRNVEDVEGLVLRLSTMPFAFTAPFRDEKILQLGLSRQVGIYLTSEYVFQALVFAVFIVACWVTIFERQYRGVLAFRRSWNLIRSMPWLALGFKVAGSVVCGRSSKWLLEKAFGWYTAVLLISAAEIYMVIAWLAFYFSARSNLEPRFSHQDLEEFLDTVR